MEFTAVRHVPDVRSLHPAHEGEAIILEGYAASVEQDRVDDVFTEKALRDALPTFMRNPVVLWHHERGKPPIGKVLEARVDNKGLFVRALLPRPPAGSWSEPIWQAAKAGLLRAWSVGGRWFREAALGYRKITRADIHELSLAPVGVNAHTVAESVATTSHVKSMGGAWVPVERDPITEYEVERLARDLEMAKLLVTAAELSATTRRRS